jgi:hypothetical protein
MTEKEFTEHIAANEGLKKWVNIARIKEITKITLTAIANLPHGEAAKLLAKYTGKRKDR